MKLWHKIFLCMFLLSLTSVGIYGSTMMRKNHLENLQREMDRSSNEIDLLSEAITKSAQSLGSTKAATAWYADYYQSKSIALVLYENGRQLFSSFEGIPDAAYTSMLDITSGEKMMYVQQLNGNNYFLTSKLLDEQTHTILFSVRDITSLYQIRTQKQKEFYLWMLFFSIIMAAASYIVAKLLVRPLNRLKKNAQSINNGIYQIACTEGRDEIGSLGTVFNSMANAVEEREQDLRTEAEKKQFFIDAMTHEMNTPLTSIQGYAQFLRNANCTDGQKEAALHSIETESRRMHAMYQKLRALQASGSDGILKEQVLLAEAVVQVREELEPLLTENQTTIREFFQTPYLKTDRVLLHLLLSNLLRNSINYSDKGSQIYISLQNEGNGSCTLAVQDFGCGIPKDCLDKVTEPFYRVDKSRSRATGGSGIGLYLCREIMQRLDGRLEINSQIGKGTTVRLIFLQS